MNEENIKPSWDDAPRWAKYMAQDASGSWLWYASRPYINSPGKAWVTSNPQVLPAGDSAPPRDASKTLHIRPDGKSSRPHHKEIEMQEQDFLDAYRRGMAEDAEIDRIRDRVFIDALAEADAETHTCAEGMKEALDKAEQVKARHAEGQRIREWLDDMGWYEPLSATDYMESAAEQMEDRAANRDALDGERSMARAVQAFNALYGHGLTETEGWQFMSLLKKSRGAGGAYLEDDYVDDIAYAALAAESAGKEQD